MCVLSGLGVLLFGWEWMTICKVRNYVEDRFVLGV